VRKKTQTSNAEEWVRGSLTTGIFDHSSLSLGVGGALITGVLIT
jgi:hypothetical protein